MTTSRKIPATRIGLAVLVTRHDRKGGGDSGESGRGSSAISGDVDVILALRRPEGNQPSSRRVIETLSRYTETPEKVIIELTDEGYVLLGGAEAVALADAVRFVSSLLGREIDQKQAGTTPLARDGWEIRLTGSSRRYTRPRFHTPGIA